MAEWHSSEEAEAWWAELQQTKDKVDKIEKRLINLAKDAYWTSLMVLAIPANDEYILERANYYSKQVYECKNEKRMSSLLRKYVDEYKMYRKSH